MVIPRMVASSFWRIYQPSTKQKQWKSMVWKSWKLRNFADEHLELVFSFQVHLSFHGYPQFSQINSSLYL